MFVIRSHDPQRPFAPDEYVTAPEAAVKRALELSALGDFPISVATDARDWATFQEGHLIQRRDWDDFYTGEPSSEYLALAVVLDGHVIVKRAKVVQTWEGVAAGGPWKQVLYRCIPQLADKYEYVMVSAVTNYGKPETLFFEANKAGSIGREIPMRSRRLFDTEIELVEDDYQIVKAAT